MAAKADDPERVDLALRSIESILDELPNLVQDWAAFSQDERIAWSLEWGNEMAKLGHLAQAEAVGRLNGRHVEVFRVLAGRTVGALSLIEQLELRCSPDSVLAAGRVRT
jgi:hypothetical protein